METWRTFFVVSLLACQSFGMSRPMSPFCEDGEHSVQGGLVEVRTLFHRDCSDFPFEVIDGPPMADINLSAYQFRGTYRSYPKLNISISNISFTSMLLKLSVDEGNVTKCLNFTVLASTDPISLFWDCSWFTFPFREYTMTLDFLSSYKSSFNYRKFNFRLPKGDIEKIDPMDMELFVYREDSSECVIFHVGQPPEAVKYLGYQFTLHEYTDHFSEVKFPAHYEPNITQKQFCDIPKFNTLYNVSVEPRICVQDKCSWGRASFSQPFYTSPQKSYAYLGFTGLIAAVVILMILTTYCSWHILKFYLSKKIVKPSRYILVYEPSSKAHLYVVEQLANFLRSFTKETVLFGETDIGLGENGSDWWPRELDKANVIIILSNPRPKQTGDLYKSSIHAPVFERGFVRESLRYLMPGNTSRQKRFIKILLPYCQEADFYDFTKTIQCYHLFKNRYRLLDEIQGIHSMCIPKCILWSLYSSVFKSDLWLTLKAAASVDRDMHSQEILDNDYKDHGNIDNSSQFSFCNHVSTSSSSEDEMDCSDSKHRHQVLERVKDDDSSDAESDVLKENDGFHAVKENDGFLAVKENDEIDAKEANVTTDKTFSTDLSSEISTVDYVENFKDMYYKFLTRPNT